MQGPPAVILELFSVLLQDFLNMICILNTIISYFGIEQAVLQRIDVIDFDRNQNEARVHFIPNLKVGVFVTLCAP